MSNLTTIVERVKRIVNDVEPRLEADIVEDIQRAQEDCEEFWEGWPFLHDIIEFSTVRYQAAQSILGANIDARFRERWLRWRTEVPPWYWWGDGVSGDTTLLKPRIMEWSVGHATDNAQTGGLTNPNDLREKRINQSGSPPLGGGQPQRILLVQDANATVLPLFGDAPSLIHIDPITDLGDPVNPGVYHLNIPVAIRQPKLVLGGTEENYWTRRLPRVLEWAASANFLRDNQDARSFEYQDKAEAELFQHKQQWKRKMFRSSDRTLTYRTGVRGTRNSGRLS